jgi:RNA polymerase sigma-70 factor (ECF subfamily)
MGMESAAQWTDEELVGQTLAGRMEAFNVLVRRHWGRIRSFMATETLNPNDLDELTQDVFVRALRGLAKFSGRASFLTWLRAIAANRAKDFRREAAIKRRFVPLEDIEHRAEAAEAERPDVSASAAEQRRIVRKYLFELPTKLRVVIMMRYIQDVGREEIAKALDLPVRTVDSRLYRAHQILKQKLSQYMSG